MTSPNPWLRAVVLAWIILSAGGVIVAAAPVVAGDAILAAVPPCPARARGERCALCGMSTSFAALARGDFVAARAAHPLGPALYAAFLVNGILALMTVGRRHFS